MPMNTAAWLGASQAPLEVKSAPYTHPRENESIVKTSSSVYLEDFPQRRQLPLLLLKFLSSNVSQQLKARHRNIRTKFIFGSTLMDNEVSRVVYEDTLPGALVEGRYVAPDRRHRSGCIQAGFDVQRKGVSARKVVASL